VDGLVLDDATVVDAAAMVVVVVGDTVVDGADVVAPAAAREVLDPPHAATIKAITGTNRANLRRRITVRL